MNSLLFNSNLLDPNVPFTSNLPQVQNPQDKEIEQAACLYFKDKEEKASLKKKIFESIRNSFTSLDHCKRTNKDTIYKRIYELSESMQKKLYEKIKFDFTDKDAFKILKKTYEFLSKKPLVKEPAKKTEIDKNKVEKKQMPCLILSVQPNQKDPSIALECIDLKNKIIKIVSASFDSEENFLNMDHKIVNDIILKQFELIQKKEFGKIKYKTNNKTVNGIYTEIQYLLHSNDFVSNSSKKVNFMDIKNLLNPVVCEKRQIPHKDKEDSKRINFTK